MNLKMLEQLDALYKDDWKEFLREYRKEREVVKDIKRLRAEIINIAGKVVDARARILTTTEGTPYREAVAKVLDRDSNLKNNYLNGGVS